MNSSCTIANSQIDRYWQLVEAAELDILRFGNRGPMPPDFNNEWNEEFELVTESILRNHAESFAYEYFWLGNGTRFLSTPFRARGPIEALMFCLNPSELMYGSTWLLQSEPYEKIKSAAVDRIFSSGEQFESKQSRRVSAKVTNKQISAEDRKELMHAMLMEHHGCHGSYNYEPIPDQPSFRKRLIRKNGGNWSDSQITIALQMLLSSGRVKVHNAMQVYKTHCQNHTICDLLLTIGAEPYKELLRREISNSDLDRFESRDC